MSIITRKIRLLSPVARHSEQLQISKDARVVENKLNEKLIMLVRSLQKLQIQPSDILYNLDYREKIDSTFRRATEQIYQIAGAYAAEFSRREYYTTRTDLGFIENLSKSYANVFFSRLQRFIIPISPQEGQEDKATRIRPESIVNMTTATLTQDVMRQAIIAKSQQVINPVIITTAAEGDTPQIVYVWVTGQDDKVCPICTGYEGQAWPFDDTASIPNIPDDTHPNCRCTLQLSEAEVI